MKELDIGKLMTNINLIKSMHKNEMDTLSKQREESTTGSAEWDLYDTLYKYHKDYIQGFEKAIEIFLECIVDTDTDMC